MSRTGRQIIEGLKEAVAGNFTRVTIEGQTWVRQEERRMTDTPAEPTLKDIGIQLDAILTQLVHLNRFAQSLRTEDPDRSRQAAHMLIDAHYDEPEDQRAVNALEDLMADVKSPKPPPVRRQPAAGKRRGWPRGKPRKAKNGDAQVAAAPS